MGRKTCARSTRSERPQTRKRNHPRHREMVTSRLNGVKAPQNRITPRSSPSCKVWTVRAVHNPSFPRRRRTAVVVLKGPPASSCRRTSPPFLLSARRGCGRMLELLGELWLLYAGAVDSAASVRCRQRLVVLPTVERSQVCVAREKAVRDWGAWSYLAAVTH